MPLQFMSDSLVIIVSTLNVLSEQFIAEATAAGFPAVSVTAENNNDTTFKVCCI